MTNVAGRATALTLVTPLRPGVATWERHLALGGKTLPVRRRADAPDVVHPLRAVDPARPAPRPGRPRAPGPPDARVPEQLQRRPRPLHRHLRARLADAHPGRLAGRQGPAVDVPVPSLPGLGRRELAQPTPTTTAPTRRRPRPRW